MNLCALLWCFRDTCLVKIKIYYLLQCKVIQTHMARLLYHCQLWVYIKNWYIAEQSEGKHQWNGVKSLVIFSTCCWPFQMPWKHCHKITSKSHNLATVHQMLAKLFKPTLSLKEEDLPLQSAPCCSLSANQIPKQKAVCSVKWRWCWQETSAWCTHKGEVSPVLWRVFSNDVQMLRATNPT